MSKLICHDCGVNYDLIEVEGHNRAGGTTVVLCVDCNEKRDEESKPLYEDCGCEEEHEQCICADCREHAEYCEENEGTTCCGARSWL